LSVPKAGPATPADPHGRGYWPAFMACTALLALPLWSVDYLPAVDLPQHAAQVAALRHYADPRYPFAANLVIDAWTPYLLGYLLALALSFVVPVHTAVTIVVTAAVLGVPLATRALLRATGGHPWWVFAAFPAALAFSFYKGFFNYVVATPLVLVLLATAAAYARAPDRRRAARIALLALLLAAAHALAFGIGVAVAGVVIAARAPSLRAAALRLTPFLPAAALMAAWLLTVRAAEPTTAAAARWLPSPERLLQLPILAAGGEPPALSLFAGALLAAALFLAGARPTRDRVRWLPFAAAALLVLLGPRDILGTNYVYPRFGVFLLPFLLFALDRGPIGARQRVGLAALPVLAAAWLVSVEARWLAYGREVDGLHDVLEAAAPHGRLLYFPVDRHSAHFASPMFIHAGMWYQVERGGLADFSFAESYLTVAHYRPGAEPPLPRDFEFEPARFRWDEHGGDLWDWFLVRSAADPATTLLAEDAVRLRPVHGANGWWLYAPRDRPPHLAPRTAVD
jgi:hypothetical protein